MRFLPWNTVEDIELLKIDIYHSPYSLIRRDVRLHHYLEQFNRSKNCLYGRVKFCTSKTFEQIKKHVLEWLCKDLHWMKAGYIQACQISNIGLLTGSCSVIDMQVTRSALENAVYNKIGRLVKLGLHLWRIKCKRNALFRRTGKTQAILSTYLRKAILRPTAGGRREVSQDQTQRCGKEAKEWRQSHCGINTSIINHYTLVETLRALKKHKKHQQTSRTRALPQSSTTGTHPKAT